MAKRTGPKRALDEFGIPMGLQINTGIWELPDEEFFEGDGEGEDFENTGQRFNSVEREQELQQDLPAKRLARRACLVALTMLAYAWAYGANWPLIVAAVLMGGVSLIGAWWVKLGRQLESAELE